MITKKQLKEENQKLKWKIEQHVAVIARLNQEIALLNNHAGTIEVFQDTANEWRWHYKSSNGRIVFPGGQGFIKSNCMRAAKRAQELLGGEELTPIVILDKDTL